MAAVSPAAGVPVAPPLEGLHRTARYFRGLRSPTAVFGLAAVAAILCAGLAAPLLSRDSPLAQSSAALLRPNAANPLGTDELGRDLWSRLLYGVRVDAVLILAAVPLGGVAGTVLGLLSAGSRWLEAILGRVFDLMIAFTALVLGVTIAALVGPGEVAIELTIVLLNVPLFGRLTRSAVLSQREREYVLAATVVGVRRAALLFRHILPNCLDALIVQLALSLSAAVFIEGAMSFLGIGVRPPQPSLGGLLRNSTNFLAQNPAYALGPMVAVTILVLGFNLIADGLNRGVLRR